MTLLNAAPVLDVDAHYLSPYALSAYVALLEKGFEPVLRLVDLAAGEHHEADFARRSLTRRVPLLTLDGFMLSESSAIAEYLDDLLPAPGHPPLYPIDLRERARARQLQAWLRSDLMPLRAERSTEVVFLKRHLGALTQAADDATATCEPAAAAAAAGGAPGPYFWRTDFVGGATHRSVTR
jgi:glutathione S-transferase